MTNANKKELLIDFNLPLKNAVQSNLTPSQLKQTIGRLDVDIIIVKGSPEPEFTAMFKTLKVSGVRIDSERPI